MRQRPTGSHRSDTNNGRVRRRLQTKKSTDQGDQRRGDAGSTGQLQAAAIGIVSGFC